MAVQEYPVDVSVIIVNYNVRYFLEQALLSVRKASRNLRVEVFVVDNNSVDDSVAVTRKKFPEVRLLANTENTGFARANNQAIRLATGKYVLLLNPDTVIEEDTLEVCFAFMEAHPEAGGLGVRMIDGAGTFLPESRRGFPSPFVAFCKTFGLSALFPKSRIFNQYYLGYLPANTTHEVEVLAGAFMWMRHTALDKVGLLDEAFFMYGEDIDLSYRIVQGGYKNYYFPETTIIHYKGESTKKGSLNYVRTFYQAMIIFARKHFEGSQARAFIWMLQAAIYFRAGLTLLRQFALKATWPLVDAALFWGGLAVLKHLWAMYRFNAPDYYAPSFLYFNAPLYTLLWLAGIYLSGGYDMRSKIGALLRGILLGAVFIAVVYGFLNPEYRTSRALIILGTAWALGITLFTRAFVHFLRHGNLHISQERTRNLAIIGSLHEVARVRELLRQAPAVLNYIGAIAPNKPEEEGMFLGTLDQLPEITRIYRVDELIFCSKDILPSQIMYWMVHLGPEIAYKIVPEESFSIIGSSSKHTPGELYTIDIRYAIQETAQRRNKRLLDLGITLLLVSTLPVQLLLQKQRIQALRNIGHVLIGRKSWVGYAHQPNDQPELPAIKPGVLSPTLRLPNSLQNAETIRRLNLLYAKDYSIETDLRILLENWRNLGHSR